MDVWIKHSTALCSRDNNVWNNAYLGTAAVCKYIARLVIEIGVWKWHPAVCLLSHVPWKQIYDCIEVNSRLCVSVW
jgi:hypothetical protein